MTYHRPCNLEMAFQILANGSPRILAGGTDVFAATESRGLVGDVLDITDIPELGGISQTAEGWRIGATAKWAEIAEARLPPAFAALQQAAKEVGSIQIQNSGTIAGNLCNASPAADGVPPLLVLDATVEIGSHMASRVVPLSKFISAVRKTQLRPDEMVLAIHIPGQAVCGGSAFEKLGARKYLVISICMAAARLVMKDGVITAAAVSVGACSPVARRLAQTERALIGQSPRSEGWHDVLVQEIRSRLDPIDDIRADAAYRNDAAAELVMRVIEKAVEQGAA